MWHTPVELLRRRKFIKDSRLSEGTFTILHHNCYSEFLSFYFHYGQFAHFEHVVKSKVNIFAIARRETRQCVLWHNASQKSSWNKRKPCPTDSMHVFGHTPLKRLAGICPRSDAMW